jgi:hypothetical protein
LDGGADAGLGRKLILGLEAVPHIAQLGKDLRCCATIKTMSVASIKPH